MKNENTSILVMLETAKASLNEVSMQVSNLETKLDLSEKERSFLASENGRLERDLRAANMVNLAMQRASNHTYQSESGFQTPHPGHPGHHPNFKYPNFNDAIYRDTRQSMPGQTSSYQHVHPGMPLTHMNLALDNYLNSSDTFNHGDISQKYFTSGYKPGQPTGAAELVTHATITQVIRLINNSNERINSLEIALAELQRQVNQSGTDTTAEANDPARSAMDETKKSDAEIEVNLIKTLHLRHEKNSYEYRIDLSNLVVNSMKLLGITRVADLATLTGVDVGAVGSMRKAIILVRIEKVARLINKLSERLDIVIETNSITVKQKTV